MKKLTELEQLQVLESSVCQKRIRLPRVDVRQVVCFNTNPKTGSGCLLSTKYHVTCYWEDGSAYIGVSEDPVQTIWSVLKYLNENGDTGYTKHADAVKTYAMLGDLVCKELPNFLYDPTIVKDVQEPKPKAKPKKKVKHDQVQRRVRPSVPSQPRGVRPKRGQHQKVAGGR